MTTKAPAVLTKLFSMMMSAHEDSPSPLLLPVRQIVTFFYGRGRTRPALLVMMLILMTMMMFLMNMKKYDILFLMNMRKG